MWLQIATFVTVIIEFARCQLGAGLAAALTGNAASQGAGGGNMASGMAMAAGMGSDFYNLGPMGAKLFSGAGMPPAMAYKMFDGSVSDFNKYKVKMNLMKSMTGGGGGGGNAGGGGGGGATGGGLGALAFGKLALFKGGGMPPLVAYKMFDGSVSDFQKYKMKKKFAAAAGANGGMGLGTLAMMDGSMADMAKFNMLSKVLSPSGAAGQSNSTSAGAGGIGGSSTFGRIANMRMTRKLCEDTPGFYRNRCSPTNPCKHALTKCTQMFNRFSVCCAKNLYAVAMFENMPGF